MNEHATQTAMVALVIGFLCFVAHTIQKCDATTPASIQACKVACGDKGVHHADRMLCECK